MNLNINQHMHPLPEKAVHEHPSSLSAERPNGALMILSATNQRILAAVQKSALTVGFISLELENLNELLDKLGYEHLYFSIEYVVNTALDQFPGHFKNCRLQFSQQIGLQHCMLCFTAGDIDETNLLEAYSHYKFHVNRLLNHHISGISPIKYAVAVGFAFFVGDEIQHDPKTLAFRGLCEAKKIAKLRRETKWLALHNEFIRIRQRQAIQSVFQPIVELQSGALVGWEALSRGPADSSFHNPMDLYAFAERYREAVHLDHICRCLAVRAAAGISPERALFMNLHPRCLKDPEIRIAEFLKAIRDQGLRNRQIILEITENTGTFSGDINRLLERCEYLRSQGFLLAIKNAGSGPLNLPALARIRPDFVKMDLSITRGIDANPAHRMTAEILARLTEKAGGRLIAEGIEQADELSALTAMGIYAGQGFYFAEPGPTPVEINPKIAVKPLRPAYKNEDWRNSTPIRKLVKPGRSVDLHTRISQVKKQLGEDSPMKSVVVTEVEKPVGLLMSYSLDSHLSTLYGPSLYYHRPVAAIMDKDPLIAESSELVEKVAKKAVIREARKVYDDIIVVDNGALMGTVSVQNMMDAMAKVQVELAKGANPLTGLPGNVMIEMEIQRREKQKILSSFLYLDLDNFKVYNDVYGFRNGDRVLKMTARILKNAVAREGADSDFIGHIGGDDFFIVTDPAHAEPVARTITQCFSAEIPGMYNETDRQCGYILGVSRDGREGRFPFISVSIGIIDCTFEHPFSLEELSERAADIKKYAKSQTGNIYLKDRRPALGATPK